MTDVPPCASKQGPKASTTGAEPAGGWARGAATCCPQKAIGGNAGVACGSCAASGAAASNSATTAHTRNTVDIYWILDRDLGVLVFEHKDIGSRLDVTRAFGRLRAAPAAADTRASPRRGRPRSRPRPSDPG